MLSYALDDQGSPNLLLRLRLNRIGRLSSKVGRRVGEVVARVVDVLALTAVVNMVCISVGIHHYALTAARLVTGRRSVPT